MLAETLPTNQLDPSWLWELLKASIYLGGLGLLWGNLRRKPSMDVELASIKQRLTTVEDRIERDLDHITAQLDAGAVLHRELQSNQAVNSERLADVQANVHQLNQRITAMATQLSELMTSLITARPKR
jgi:ABC-type phosphate transport system auxiliary subunit